MLQLPFTLCLVFCAIVSSKGNHAAEEYVDLIELNHFYDQQGRLVYDQVIFYEQAPETGRFQVRAWCLVEDREDLNRRPVKNYQTQLYQVDWFDTDQRVLRKVTSRLFRESWTQVDPERANKKVHDERLRISMIQNPKKFLAAQTQFQPAEEPKQSSGQSGSIASTELMNTQSPIANTPALPRPEALVAR